MDAQELLSAVARSLREYSEELNAIYGSLAIGSAFDIPHPVRAWLESDRTTSFNLSLTSKEINGLSMTLTLEITKPESMSAPSSASPSSTQGDKP